MQLRVAITGASGLVGSHLSSVLSRDGHDVRAVVRQKRQRSGDITWDPDARTIDAAALEGLDAVVHLAGENIASGRWTASTRQRILGSRVGGTRLLSQTLASLSSPPPVLVCASAVGFYGSRGSLELDESSGRGSGFLSDVCDAWESSAGAAREAGIRVVHLRFGVVLTPHGGALAQMLPAFRIGAGATLGTGRQYMSWIALDDALAAVQHSIGDASLSGPVNATAPHPVTNREFTEELGSALRRPVFLRIPEFVLRAGLGDMADEMLLSSARVLPRKLLASGFRFRYPVLGAALAGMFRQTGGSQT